MESSEAGFSLIEIIVAIGVLMVVMVALLPQLVLGLQATGTARLSTQAKGVAQGQLEQMRNLPYHISPNAGDYRDVLDTYYRNVTAPAVGAGCMASGTYVIPTTTWSGYVRADNAARCDYEPAGAMYRKVSTVTTADSGADFTVVVDTQFLSNTTPPQPVTPLSTYNSQQPTHATPATSQVGVVVTVLYREGDDVKAVTTSTQMANRPTVTTRVRAEANVAAVEVGSETTDGGALALSAGLVDLTGSLTYASTVNANLAGTSASSAAGEQATGADASVAAPPSSTAGSVTKAPGVLTGVGCGLACWGNTRIDLGTVSASAGLPQAGSQAAPMQALVTDRGGHGGISFGNSNSAQYRDGLGLATPLVRMSSAATATPSGISSGCVAGGSGTSSYLTGGGYLRTTAVDVESCSVSRTSTISLFPTTFAPQGVVQVELTQAKARCSLTGAAHTASATYDFSAVVRYYTGSAYQELTVTDGMTTDPLAAVDLATTSVGGGHVLGDYIASWSSLLDNEITATQALGVAKVTVPGIVKIASMPMRADADSVDGLDATSVVSVAVGTLGCHAEDNR